MSPSTDPPKIQLLRIAFVHYKHKNATKAGQFMADFGFTEKSRVGNKVYYSGYGTEPFVYCLEHGDEDKFGGTAFVVSSLADLQLAQKLIPTASEIYELLDAPGGGSCVTFTDPIDGFPFHLVYGQTPAAPTQDFDVLSFNFVGDGHLSCLSIILLIQ